MAACITSRSFNGGLTGVIAVTLVLIAVTCFSLASFSCTAFEFLGDPDKDDDFVQPPFAFGFWNVQSASGSCVFRDSFESVDVWLQLGRILGITGCQLGLAIAVASALALYYNSFSKDFAVRMSFFGLIAASLLSISLLVGMRSDVCKTESGDYQCRLNLSSVAGVSLVLSILIYGLAGYFIHLLAGIENNGMLRDPIAQQPLTLNIPNPTASYPNDNHHTLDSATEDDHVVETIQEPNGLRLKKTTKRSVQTDGSKVLRVTTENLSLPMQASNDGPIEPSWSSMVVETVSKDDGSVTKTTTQTFDEPENGIRFVQRTVEITESKLRTLADGIENVANIGRNGKMVEIDTIRQQDGSAITTTTTTTHKGSNLFLVKRVILISETGVRRPIMMESESTVSSEQSNLATRRNDIHPQTASDDQLSEDSPEGRFDEKNDDVLEKGGDMQFATTKSMSPKSGGEETKEPSDDDSCV